MKKKLLHFTVLAFAMLFICSAFACGTGSTKEDPKAVKSLAIGVKPDVTTYYEGDTFDPAGTRIDANNA